MTSKRLPVMPDNTGILEVLQGDGRLRELDGNYVSDPRDPVISSNMINKYQLRPGVELEVELGRPIGGNGRGMPQQPQRGRRGKKKPQQRRKKKIKMKDRKNPVDPKAR